jgi:phage terminase large subunit-like protein
MLRVTQADGTAVDIPRYVWEPGKNDAQVNFIATQARHAALVGGFGSGKTASNVLKGLLQTQAHPGCSGMFVSATYPLMARTLKVELDTWLHTFKLAWGLKYTEQKVDRCYRFDNGSTIWLGTAETPESLYGTDLSWFGGDEVALWKKRSFDIMLDRLRQPRYPHQAWATYTPMGKGWWCDYFEPDGSLRLSGCELFRCASYSNPLATEDFIVSLQSRYTGQWALQYIEGFAQQFEGLIWPMLSTCEYTGELPKRWKRLVGGVDWGWDHPSVLILVGIDYDDRPWAFGEFSDTRVQPEKLAEVAFERHRFHPEIEAWFCDPSQPANIGKWQALGLNALPAVNAVIPGISSVQRLIDFGLRVVDCPRLLNEQWAWEMKDDGTFDKDRPQKVDDDSSDALRYGTMGLGEYKPQRHPVRLVEPVRI